MSEFRLPIWDSLWKVRELPVIRTSAIWVVFVPIAAKFFSTTAEELDFSNYIDGLVVTMAMPFSFYQLYASALCFAVANLICIIFCPAIVRQFLDFEGYVNGGGSAKRLMTYVEENKVANVSERDLASLSQGSSRSNDVLREVFFTVRDSEAQSWAFVRFLACVLYAAGFWFIAEVTYANFIFVFGL